MYKSSKISQCSQSRFRVTSANGLEAHFALPYPKSSSSLVVVVVVVLVVELVYSFTGIQDRAPGAELLCRNDLRFSKMANSSVMRFTNEFYLN